MSCFTFRLAERLSSPLPLPSSTMKRRLLQGSCGSSSVSEESSCSDSPTPAAASSSSSSNPPAHLSVSLLINAFALDDGLIRHMFVKDLTPTQRHHYWLNLPFFDGVPDHPVKMAPSLRPELPPAWFISRYHMRKFCEREDVKAAWSAYEARCRSQRKWAKRRRKQRREARRRAEIRKRNVNIMDAKASLSDPRWDLIDFRVLADLQFVDMCFDLPKVRKFVKEQYSKIYMQMAQTQTGKFGTNFSNVLIKPE